MNRQQLDNLEARFGYRAAARLSESADALPHDVCERLKVARANAMARRKVTKTNTVSTTAGAVEVSVNADGSLNANGAFGGSEGDKSGDKRQRGQKSGAWTFFVEWALPVLVISAALIGLSEWNQSNQIASTADMDAAVLADELPTQAYTDPGFAQFLKNDGEALPTDTE